MNNTAEHRNLGEQLLLRTDTTVTCPACKHEFSLSDGFAKKALEELARGSTGNLSTFEKAIREEERKKQERQALGKQQALEDQIETLTKSFADREKEHERALNEVRDREKQSATAELNLLKQSLEERDAQLGELRARRHEVDEKAKTLAQREQDLQDQIEAKAKDRAVELIAQEKRHLENELREKNVAIADYQAKELELRREKSKLEEAMRSVDLDVQRKVDAEKFRIEDGVRATEAEKFKLREAELQKTVDDMSAKLAEAQRKASQGSQQLQGEVFETLLEDQLREAFPLDLIEEIKKGAKGADVLQRVMTRAGQSAGSILWEAKRTTAWGKDWTTKLKDDLRASGAEIGVIVSVTLPKEFGAGQPFGLLDEVWVTCPAAALPLGEALRSELSAVHKQRLISAGKGEKMEALYDYLTSAQFAQKIKAVYTAFKKMRDELESEKSITQQRWARREKQIQQATREVVAIAGDIQGLAHEELPELEMETPALEAPDGRDAALDELFNGEESQPS